VAQKSYDFSRKKIHAHVGNGMHAAEAFVDSPHFDEWLHDGMSYLRRFW
jgi:hypothetical protein